MDRDLSLRDFKEIVIYDPITEENEDENEQDDDQGPLSLSEETETKRCRSPPPPRRSRKRDSAALFDISVGDLPDPDLAGFLTEKHSNKQWWCILVDQHLCIFPSQDPDDIAYDVVILPCCQISLDDRLLRTPVFRLTQSGMTPWVMIAENNTVLKEWIHALTTAASGGKYTIAPGREKRNRARTRTLQGIDNIAEEDEEAPEEEEKSEVSIEEQVTESWKSNDIKFSDVNTLSTLSSNNMQNNVNNKENVDKNSSDKTIAVNENENQLTSNETLANEERKALREESKIPLELKMKEKTMKDSDEQLFVTSGKSKPEPPKTLALTDKVMINHLLTNSSRKLIVMNLLKKQLILKRST